MRRIAVVAAATLVLGLMSVAAVNADQGESEHQDRARIQEQEHRQLRVNDEAPAAADGPQRDRQRDRLLMHTPECAVTQAECATEGASRWERADTWTWDHGEDDQAWAAALLRLRLQHRHRIAIPV